MSTVLVQTVDLGPWPFVVTVVVGAAVVVAVVLLAVRGARRG
jgi:hypothetical protein